VKVINPFINPMSKNQTIGISLLVTSMIGICLTVRYCDPPADVAANLIPAAQYREPEVDNVRAELQARFDAGARRVEKFHFSMTGIEMMKGALDRSRMNRCNEQFLRIPNSRLFLHSNADFDMFNQKMIFLHNQLSGMGTAEFPSEDALRSYYIQYLNEIESADSWLSSSLSSNVDYSCRYI
jgi:hypothetical protein